MIYFKVLATIQEKNIKRVYWRRVYNTILYFITCFCMTKIDDFVLCSHLYVPIHWLVYIFIYLFKYIYKFKDMKRIARMAMMILKYSCHWRTFTISIKFYLFQKDVLVKLLQTIWHPFFRYSRFLLPFLISFGIVFEALASTAKYEKGVYDPQCEKTIVIRTVRP